MRCRTCGYALWNLRTRQCPECGAAFYPSEFEFSGNAVCYCCPHCDQAYYGTDENGHLSPRAFDCVQCAEHISMDEMVLRPAEGVSDWQTEPEINPWVKAKGREHYRAWFQTVGRAMVMPHRLMSVHTGERPHLDAWSFMVTTSFVIAIATVLPFALFSLIIGFFATVGGGAQASSMWVGMLGFWGAGAAFLVVTCLVSIVLWGLCAHLILKLTGSIESTIGRTFQALCYSSGANVATAFPCVGLYVGWIWWTISAIFTLRVAQRVSALRAIFAAVAFPVFAVLSLLGLYVYAIFSFGQMAATMNTTVVGSTTSAVATDQVVRTTLQYAADHQGEFPAHSAQLLLDGALSHSSLLITGTQTQAFDVPLGSTDLQRFAWLPVDEQELHVQQIVDALPEEIVAHRLGDFVFCWHGVNYFTADDAIWLVIASPDPDSNQPPSLQQIRVGLLDGTTLSIPLSEWDDHLAEQNELRAAHNLPPLMQPEQVRHLLSLP